MSKFVLLISPLVANLKNCHSDPALPHDGIIKARHCTYWFWKGLKDPCNTWIDWQMPNMQVRYNHYTHHYYQPFTMCMLHFLHSLIVGWRQFWGKSTTGSNDDDYMSFDVAWTWKDALKSREVFLACVLKALRILWNYSREKNSTFSTCSSGKAASLCVVKSSMSLCFKGTRLVIITFCCDACFQVTDEELLFLWQASSVLNTLSQNLVCTRLSLQLHASIQTDPMEIGFFHMGSWEAALFNAWHPFISNHS